MKIVTWNVRYRNGGDDARGCGWATRLLRIVESLRALKPDIFAVQEAHFEQMNDLRAAFPAYESAGVGREDGANDGEHCGIFFSAARFWLRAQETHWLSPTPDTPSRGWDATCTRIVTKAWLFDRETEAKLTVWNTHLDHQSAKARIESARLLRRHALEAEVPLLLCGDFNCAPGSAPIAELTDSLRDARSHAARVEGEIATCCGFGAPLHGERNRIDYVLASREWQIESYRVPEDRADWPPASDHRPVVVEAAFIAVPMSAVSCEPQASATG